jgi:hypothetical protein
MKRILLALILCLITSPGFAGGGFSGGFSGGGGSASVSAYTDVTGVFGGGACSGYLKSDGTCDTPSGGDITAAGNNTFTGSNVIGDGGDLQKVQHMRPTADDTWSGEAILVTSSAALAVGEVVYLNADGKAAKALATATTTMPAICVMVQAASGADESKFCMTRGMYKYPAAHTDFTVTGGSTNLIYVSRSTAGAATSTIPTTSGDQVQVIGTALAADLAFYNFNFMLVQVP